MKYDLEPLPSDITVEQRFFEGETSFCNVSLGVVAAVTLSLAAADAKPNAVGSFR